MIVEAKAQADGKPLGFYSGGRENAVASVTVKGVGRCLDCQLSSRCLHDALSELGVDEFRALVFSHRRLQSGDCVFRSGETFQAIYLVRAGFVKTVVLLEDGREQVTGLYMPGDMLGMDGIASGTHASDAIALADADVCVIPYERLEAMSHQEPSMRRHLHRLLSGEIIREQRMMLLLGSMSAEERVAAFLVNLSQRFAARGFSSSEFVLRLTREEIGSMLGIKLETVSRIFSRLQKGALIQIDGKHVRIVNAAGLQQLTCR